MSRKHLQECTACDGNVIDAVSDVLKDGAASGEVVRGAKVNLSDDVWYGGGRPCCAEGP